jgi:hypothetical protein
MLSPDTPESRERGKKLQDALADRTEDKKRRLAEWLASLPHVLYTGGALFMGRHGSCPQHGLLMTPTPDYIRLTPLNAQIAPAPAAWLDIPLADLPAVIAKLQSLQPAAE